MSEKLGERPLLADCVEEVGGPTFWDCKESGAREFVGLRPALGRASGSALPAFGGSERWQRGGTRLEHRTDLSVLFGVGSAARSASKSGPRPRTATHCIDELIVRPAGVTVGSRLGVKSQADSHPKQFADPLHRFQSSRHQIPKRSGMRS